MIYSKIDTVIIENQISTLASRMKTLQGMITQYFIMKNIPQIEFISASCKLKLFADSTHHVDAGDVGAIEGESTEPDQQSCDRIAVDGGLAAKRSE